MSETHATHDWLDSICTLRELLSLSDNELVQLEEIDGDVALKAAWWRRRTEREYIMQRGYEPVVIDGREVWLKCHAGYVLSREGVLQEIGEGCC